MTSDVQFIEVDGQQIPISSLPDQLQSNIKLLQQWQQQLVDINNQYLLYECAIQQFQSNLYLSVKELMAESQQHNFSE